MKGLTKKEAEALRLFKQELLKQFPDQVEELKLFGSKARGEANKFSDVDVWVVMKKGSWRDHFPMRKISTSVMLDTDVDLSLHIFTTEDLRWMRRSGSPLLMNVEAEGVSI